MYSALNNLSVKYKLFGLVLVPISLLILLASRQVLSITQQVSELERSNSLSIYLQEVSTLYRDSQKINIDLYTEQQEDMSKRLKMLASNAFPTDALISEQGELIEAYSEATLSVYRAEDVHEELDAIDWQADLYKQMLLAIERQPSKHSNAEVNHHLSTLIQLEWLMYWSYEEEKLSRILLSIYNTDSIYEPDIADEIQTLSQRELLFVERFVTLNAKEDQVSLLIKTFRDDAFNVAQQFRTGISQQSTIASLSEQETQLGLTALSTRLVLISSVGKTIISQFQTEVTQAINDAESQLLLFISGVVILILLVIVFALTFARRVTNNLNLILNFIQSNDLSRQSQLFNLVQGKDELSLFAQQVQRLTIERHQANERLTIAKDDAEKAKDKAIQASKAKSSFLANMSHEIRTPLNGVIGISEVLADTELSPTQKDYVDTIETSSQLLLSLINDILDFSKIESGMLLITPNSTCIRESLYDIASIIAPKAREKGINLEVKISPEIPSRVMVDDHRLRQVLMNFMSNAVKFTLSGTVTLSIDCLRSTPESSTIRFSVSDSGIGISKQQQKSIFEPFAQEDNSTTRQFGGTGLGLAISTQLIDLMGGEIGLQSDKGEGSCFFFDLDLTVEVQKHINTTPMSPINVVCYDLNQQDIIANELNFYHVKTACWAKSLDELSTQLSKQSDISPVTLLIAPRQHAGDEHIDTLALTLESIGTTICLVRPFTATSNPFVKNISALVSAPLLGSRLIKALNICHKKAPLNQKANNEFLAPEALNSNKSSSKALASKTCASETYVPETCVSETVSSQAKILIVDDNSVNRKIAGLHVKKAGFEFDLANDGQQAVDMYINNPCYAVILMDCMMPVMDGFNATKRIREFESEQPHPNHVPIIALTASVIDDDIQKCFDVGMDDYVAKPFKANTLKEKLVEAVGKNPIAFNEKNTDRDTTLLSDNLDDDNQLSGSLSNVKLNQKILLVEDNLTNQKVASIMLKRAGYSFDIAENGQIAVDKYKEGESYSMILMDCMMPVKDGFTATEEIREHEKKRRLKHIPIIALTASIIDDDIQRCFDSGMNAYVAKPIKLDKLLHQIESVIV